jgi:hypothetical protein
MNTKYPVLRLLRVPALPAPKEWRAVCSRVVLLDDMFRAARKIGRARRMPKQVYAFRMKEKTCVYADFAEAVLKAVCRGYDFGKKVGEA